MNRNIVFCFLLLLAGRTAQAQGPTYTITDLGSLYGSIYAYGINSSGQVAGVYYTRYAYAAFVYNNGSLTDLGNAGNNPLPDHTTAAAYAINDSGQIVGQYTYTSLGPRGGRHVEGGAFLYQNGQFQSIGGYSDDYASGLQAATAINNAGQIVGYDIYGKAALYQNGVVTQLNPLAKSGVANAINNVGEIAGTDGITAFSYHSGVEQILPALDPTVNYGSAALGINDSGMVIGVFWSQRSFQSCNPMAKRRSL